jgi:uncharacterized protein (TIGR00106 family)
MAMMEISVVPLGTGKPSVSAHVAAVFKRLQKQKGVEFELNAMGTIVTGKTEVLLALAAALHRIPFGRGAQRVYTVIKLDERRDKKQRPVDKVDSVLKKL